uniref:Exopolygalacturonase n=1 Tax=Zea mays TaxID=4577 RepID=A0A804QK99_MAIZE
MASAHNALRVFFILAVVCAVCTAKRTGANKEESAAAPGGAAGGSGGTFDISKLGATSDGKTDCTKAVQDAWTSACEATGSATVVIPKGDYLVGPLNFTGPCKGSNIAIQLDGNLLGSNDLDKYTASWIELSHVNNIGITGSGTLDGQGTAVYSKSKTDNVKAMPNFFHINIDNSESITVKDVNITAPADVENTDGVHVGGSSKISILNSTIGTGDDCVSIGPGCNGVLVDSITCGPGQGISVGCLGRYKDEKDVSDITVRNCVLKNTTNGVRIKSYVDAESVLTASHLTFENIRMEEVANPIVIDQYFCPQKVCPGKRSNSSHVSVKDVTFRNITGTSSTPEAISLLCSETQPCSGVSLIDVNVEYAGKNNKTMAVCSNAKGTAKGSIEALACLV